MHPQNLAARIAKRGEKLNEYLDSEEGQSFVESTETLQANFLEEFEANERSPRWTITTFTKMIKDINEIPREGPKWKERYVRNLLFFTLAAEESVRDAMLTYPTFKQLLLSKIDEYSTNKRNTKQLHLIETYPDLFAKLKEMYSA